MSFDVYLQDFSDAPADRRVVVERVLAPLLDARGWNIVTSDGSAAVHAEAEGPLRGVMFNHIEGGAARDVIYEVAVVGHWVVLPVGGPVCIVAEEQAGIVPDELLRAGVVLVGSGRELHQAVTRDPARRGD